MTAVHTARARKLLMNGIFGFAKGVSGSKIGQVEREGLWRRVVEKCAGLDHEGAGRVCGGWERGVAFHNPEADQ